MSRRFLAFLVSLVLAFALLAGCSQSAPAPTTAPATRPPAASAPTSASGPAQQATTPAASSAATPAATSAAAQSQFNWKQFSGQKIVLLVEQHPWTTAIQPLISQFETLTGIQVETQVFTEQQQRQKSQIALQAKSPEFDVFMSLKSFEGWKYARAGYYEPLEPYLNNPQLTPSDFDSKDFLAGAFNGEKIDGKLYGLPIIVEGPVIFYRSDLFKQYNIAPPKTMADIETAAAAIKKDSNGSIYGVTLRGLPQAVAYTFGPFYHNEGLQWLTSDNKPQLSDPKGVAALDYYGKLAREYGPPGVVQYSFYQSSSLFASGKVGMEIESSNELSTIIDPKSSQVVGKVDVIPFPPGPGGDHPTELQWGISMNAFSQHKDAAWLFMVWATSKQMEADLALKGIASPRASSWETSQFKASLTDQLRKDWAAAVQHTVAVGNAEVGPPAVDEPQVRQIIGDMVDSVILGQSTAADAAKKADAALAPLVK